MAAAAWTTEFEVVPVGIFQGGVAFAAPPFCCSGWPGNCRDAHVFGLGFRSVSGQSCPVKRSRWIVLLLVVATDLGVLLYWRDRREHRFDQAIRNAAARNGIPAALVKAVVWRESRFDPDARGQAGELGLMQLMDDAALEWATAQRLSGFTHEHVLDPVTNTLAGSFYLAKLLRRYTNTDNPLPYALADYNAGRGNVLRWMKGDASSNSAAFCDQISFPSTRSYVDTVTDRYRHYRGEGR